MSDLASPGVGREQIMSLLQRLLVCSIVFCLSQSAALIILIHDVQRGFSMELFHADSLIILSLVAGMFLTLPFLFEPSRYASSVIATIAWLAFTMRCFMTPTMLACRDWGALTAYSYGPFLWLLVWLTYYFRKKRKQERWYDAIPFGILFALAMPASMYAWFLLIPANIIPPLHIPWLAWRALRDTRPKDLQP